LYLSLPHTIIITIIIGTYASVRKVRRSTRIAYSTKRNTYAAKKQSQQHQTTNKNYKNNKT
jgi:F0F1-type ATP synthase assembly protein I